MSVKLVNLISPQLTILAAEFEKLDKLTIALRDSIGKMGADAGGLRKLTTAANASNKAFEKASLSAAALHKNIQAIGSSGGVPGLLPAPGGGRPGGGGGGGGRGRGQGSPFHGGNIHMGAGGVGLGTMGMSAGDWFVPLAVTGAAIYGGKSLFNSAMALDTEKQRFKQFGMTDAQNNEAFKFATGMRVYGMSQTENMRDFREAQGVLRESGLSGSAALAGAKIATPILSRLNALDASLDDESAAKSHSSNMAMLKWIESAGGLKSQAEFNRLANMGYKLKVGSGDTVDWSQLQQFQKRAGSAAINMSGEGFARIEPSISTLGGASAGTALATQFGRMQGIVKGLQVPVIDELLKYGVWDRKKVELNSKGGIAKFLDPNGPMSAENSKLLSENPESFYEKVIRPIYSKMNLDAAGVIRQNAMIYGRTGGALANEWEKQLETIHRAVDAFAKTKDIGASTAQLPDSLSGQMKEFDAAWTDFKTQFGTTMLPFFSGILKGVAAMLRPTSTGSSPLGYLTGWSFLSSAWDMVTSPSTGGPSKFVSRQGNGGQKTTPIILKVDGKTLAQTSVRHMGPLFANPQSGTSTFDSIMAPQPAGGL